MEKDIKNEIEQLILDIEEIRDELVDWYNTNSIYRVRDELEDGYDAKHVYNVIEKARKALESDDKNLLKESRKSLIDVKRDLKKIINRRIYRERKKKEKIIMKSIKIGAGIIAVLGVGVSCCKFVKYEKDTWYQKPANYYACTLVEYNGSQYNLNSLYKLTFEDACYICKKVEKSHTETKIVPAMTPNGYRMGLSSYTVDDPDVYVDIKTNKEVCVEGYESIFRVKVEKLSDYFTFEEYGTEGAENNTKTIITEDQVNDIMNNKETGLTK